VMPAARPGTQRKRAKYRKINRTFWPLVAPLARGRYSVLAREIAKALGIKQGDRVLETHCGMSPHFRAWKAAAGKEGRVVAVDIDPFIAGILKIKQALRTRKKNRAEIRIADAENLPFEDRSFDKYIAILPDAFSDKMIGEMHRVLKPGGLAFVMCSDEEIRWVKGRSAGKFSVIEESGRLKVQAPTTRSIVLKKN